MRIVDQSGKSLKRYLKLSVPEWFKVKLTPAGFSSSPFCNNLLALFHFNKSGCEIVPTSQVIDYKRCKMSIDHSLFWVKMKCASVEEAKKRAIVLAYLTYDLTRQQFVKFHTSSMLHNPFHFNDTYKLHELFSLEQKLADLNINFMAVKQ